MARKGQSLPLNTIVIAIIVIIVMVVIIAIYSGSMGTWLQNLRSKQELPYCNAALSSGGAVWADECGAAYPNEKPISEIDAVDVANNPNKKCCYAGTLK